MRSGLLCLGIILSAGCSGTIDVGPGGSGGGQSSSAGASGSNAGAPGAGALACQDPTPLPIWPATIGCTPGADLPLVGTWHGYIENQDAPWDDLTLVVSGASVSGGLCGTLRVGAGPAPAPATDPSVGYPDPSAFFLDPTPPILAGYTFTLLNATTDGTRVRFGIGSNEPWKDWCGLQTSYSAGSGPSCNCLPDWGSHGDRTTGCELIDPSGSQVMSVNCAKLKSCTQDRVCQCDVAGCTAAPSSGFDFDLRFTGDTGEGSSTSAVGPRAHFTRVP